MSTSSVVVSAAVLSVALLLGILSTPVNAQRAKRFSGPEVANGEIGNPNVDDAIRDYVYNLIISRMGSEPEPMMMSKRGPHGYLDFGVSRGASGAEAAKARLGLKLAHNPFGPGR